MLVLRICFVGLCCIAGCAAQTQHSDPKLKELEKKVMQLKAENINLHAKTRYLDDKVLLYEKKKAIAGKKKAENGLRTVRLSPTGNFDEQTLVGESVYEDELVVSFKDAPAKGEKRPVLRLSERSFSEHSIASPSSSASSSASPSATTQYENIPMTHRGENLGVVSANGQLEQAEADSMALFNAAYRAYNNKDYSGALAGFSTFLQKESNHKFADNAMFWIAECHLAQGKLFNAVGEFERLLRRYPRSEKAASSLYRIGFIYDRMQDAAKAKEYYFKVVDEYPGSEAARKASRRMTDNNGNARLVRTSAKR